LNKKGQLTATASPA